MKGWIKVILGEGLFNVVSSLEAPRLAYRAMLLSMVITVLSMVMFGFAVLHYFYTLDMPLALASVIAFFILILIFSYLRYSQNILLTGHLSSVAIVLFFPIYAHLNQNDQFGLIWLFVVPFLAIAFNGYKVGVGYVAVYLTVIITMAFQNIGVWQDGLWTELSVIRLFVGLAVFTTLALMLDLANDHLNKRIERQRRKEDVYLSKLKRLSMVDSLTSVYNRHHFNQVLAQKVTELKDSDLYLTFFILDIDHFKLYNDHFGHQKGDEALQAVAEAVSHFMKRQNDLVFRMGGEEFSGVVVSDTPAEISVWLEHLIKKIENLNIPHAPDASHPNLTASMGVFSAQIDNLNCINVIYRTADQALYQAKARGRNQTVIIKPLNRQN